MGLLSRALLTPKTVASFMHRSSSSHNPRRRDGDILVVASFRLHDDVHLENICWCCSVFN